MEIRTIVNNLSNPLSSSSGMETILFKKSRERRLPPDRVPFMRTIPYFRSVIEEGSTDTEGGQAVEDQEELGLSMNLSSSGMLIVMEEPSKVDQVLRVRVPTPADEVGTPTLAEVRWSRKLPFSMARHLRLAGLKFLI